MAVTERRQAAPVSGVALGALVAGVALDAAWPRPAAQAAQTSRCCGWHESLRTWKGEGEDVVHQHQISERLHKSILDVVMMNRGNLKNRERDAGAGAGAAVAAAAGPVGAVESL